MRLEEEVVLDGAEELQESDDEAIRMELLRAREKAEEKAERGEPAAVSVSVSLFVRRDTYYSLN